MVEASMDADLALSRIRALDPRLHAFAQVFDPPMGRGAGPTVAIKDLIDVAGRPTGGGARSPLVEAAPRSAVVVDRLLAAGCVIVGKTQTVELAYGGYGTNRAVGAPRNPWRLDPHHAPGGSSSGSAAAVAAGLCDAAVGTDTGGSVRIPAALCGVVGLKPGRGLVSREGVHPLSPSLDTVGALAPDVSTAARLLAAMAGGGWDTPRARFDAEAALSAHPRGRPIAAIPPERLPGLHPEVAKLYGAALERLRRDGFELCSVTPDPPWEAFFEPTTVLMAGEGWRCWAERVERLEAEMDPWVARRLRAGAAISDGRLRSALDRREGDQAAADAWLARYVALLMPTCPIPAPRLDAVDETVSPLSSLTRGANYLDLPAASVPCGLTGEGLPVGLQIIGARADEAGVVALAAAFERVSGWEGRTPFPEGEGG